MSCELSCSSCLPPETSTLSMDSNLEPQVNSLLYLALVMMSLHIEKLTDSSLRRLSVCVVARYIISYFLNITISKTCSKILYLSNTVAMLK